MSRSLRPAPLLLLTACISGKPDSADPSGGPLSWYTSCGDPVCSGYNAAAHSNAPCSTEAVGDTCSPAGAGCDLQDDCNTELVCAGSDPKLQEGGCPISLAAAKADIRYLDAGQRQALHQELLQLRLAEYRYRTEAPGAARHLGFLIDEQPAGSYAVLPRGDRVDLYGYTSMAVAALQTQQALIEAQQAQIAALEARLAALEAAQLPR